MNRTPRISRALRSACSVVLATGIASLTVLAQAPVNRDVAAIQQAQELSIAGKYQEAAAIFEKIPKDFPTSPLIPDAILGDANCYYMLGDYDKAVQLFQSVPGLKGVAPETAERASSLVAQISLAKAVKLAPEDPARKSAFENAAKQFDAFIQKYPQSEEVESANYGKGVALFQAGRYDDAATALRTNLQKFPNSEGILDSQYLLAMTLATLANTTAQKATTKDPTVDANYDEAEKLLGEIIQKRTDVALMNDARFQIAELLLARAGSIKDDKQRTATLVKALESYRLVASKEGVVQAQKQRIEFYKNRRLQLLRDPQNRDLRTAKRIETVVLPKEQEKLANLEGRGDQTLTAKIKSGQIFFQLGKMDETRVVLGFAKQFAEDNEQKKQIAYFQTLSYATQEIKDKEASEKLSDKAVEAYNQFKTDFAKDPMGDNLGILVGARFVDTDPEKALKYFKECVDDYPNGRYKIQALTQQAAALSKMKRYDEALQMFNQTLTASTDPTTSAAAQFGIATIYQQTGKMEDAIKGYKEVRDKYTGTPQAEQAAYYVGQATFDKGDMAGAIPELQSFTKNFANSDLMPNAMFFLGLASAQTGKNDEAYKLFKEIGERYKEAEVAPFAYFERAKLVQSQGKTDECIAIMREFISAYPNNAALYQAYDYIAQIHVANSRASDAIATYEEFVKAKSEDPASAEALLKAAAIWKSYAESQGLYATLDEAKRGQWKKGVDSSIGLCERVVNDYPETPQVALALKMILDCQKMRKTVKLASESDIEAYFQTLAKKFESKPSTRSKIVFTLASYTFEKDKKKAIEQMSTVYDASQKYAAGDLDLYGLALIQQGKLDEAGKIYDKIAADYPVPKNVEPTKAPTEIQNAQAIALFGQGKVLQEQKNLAEAQKKFDDLKQLYPWTEKMQEANYGIAASMHEQKKLDEALLLLIGVIKAPKAAAEVRAKGMLLLARIHEEKGNYDTAIDNYLKIKTMFESVPAVAAEGLWRGAQLLEKEGNGAIPMPIPATPVPKTGAKPGGPGKPPAAGAAGKPAPARH